MKIVFLVLILLSCLSLAEEKSYKRVAYLTPSDRSINSLNFTKISDLIIRKIEVRADGTLIHEDLPNTLNAIINKAQAAKIDVLIMCSGSSFRELVYSPTARNTFIDEITHFCVEHTLQGVELHWESETGFNNRDRVSFTLLLKELRDSFTVKELLLTISGGTWSYEINNEAIVYLDWLNIRSYDMGIPDHATMEDALRAVKWWRDFGFPSEKLTLGIPFYGRNIYGNAKSYGELYKAFSTETVSGDIVDGYHFNGSSTVRKKAQLVVDSSLLGVNISEISQDYQTEPQSLLSVIDTTFGTLGTPLLSPRPKTAPRIRMPGNNQSRFDLRGRAIPRSQPLPSGIYLYKNESGIPIKEITK